MLLLRSRWVGGVSSDMSGDSMQYTLYIMKHVHQLDVLFVILQSHGTQLDVLVVGIWVLGLGLESIWILVARPCVRY